MSLPVTCQVFDYICQGMNIPHNNTCIISENILVCRFLSLAYYLAYVLAYLAAPPDVRIALESGISDLSRLTRHSKMFGLEILVIGDCFMR